MKTARDFLYIAALIGLFFLGVVGLMKATQSLHCKCQICTDTDCKLCTCKQQDCGDKNCKPRRVRRSDRSGAVQ